MKDLTTCERLEIKTTFFVPFYASWSGLKRLSIVATKNFISATSRRNFLTLSEKLTNRSSFDKKNYNQIITLRVLHVLKVKYQHRI